MGWKFWFTVAALVSAVGLVISSVGEENAKAAVGWFVVALAIAANLLERFADKSGQKQIEIDRKPPQKLDPVSEKWITELERIEREQDEKSARDMTAFIERANKLPSETITFPVIHS